MFDVAVMCIKQEVDEKLKIRYCQPMGDPTNTLSKLINARCTQLVHAVLSQYAKALSRGIYDNVTIECKIIKLRE